MTRKLIGLTVALFFLSGIATVFAQEKVSPLSDYQYKKDYPQYEAIKKEADVQKRADLLLAFVKERSISRILLYAATDYMECVKPQIEKKDWTKVISMEEELLAILPTTQTVQAAGIPTGVDEYLKDQLAPTQKLVLSNLLQAYLQSNNLPKGAETAEKLYAMNPDKSMLPILANIYLGMKNYDKFLDYGQKILADTPMDQGYTLALQMAQVYLQKQDIPTAIGLFSKIMDVYGDKVPPNVPEAQWNTTRAFAYGVIASSVYATKDYAKTQELYEKVVKFDPKRDDAYYYIGLCKWQNKDQDGAIAAFAKAVVLNKTAAPKAKDYLERLYKAQHNDSLDGLDQVLAKAKAELGVN
jgi:tetratricopeptide (TPR) repeat protein